jgi:copper resistance protein B
MQPAADPHASHQMPAQQQPPPAGAEAVHPMPTSPAQADPHAGHQMPGEAPSTPPTDPHAGHAAPPAQPATDPHLGHGAPLAQPETDPHAGHQMAPTAGPPVAPPPPEAMSGPAHAADLVFGAEQMAGAREELHMTHGAHRFQKFMIDQLEISVRDGAEGYAWEDVQFWYGGDIDKLWLKSEGEGEFGEGLERGDVQALWSHAIDPWFDLQAGVRMNFGRGPERPHLVIGIQGLAPYWFEIDAAAFLSSSGDVTGRIEAEYDLRITQRLILQPQVELEWALQDVPELRIGSGLSSAEAGLRLRYEIVPEFAPYVGIAYERAFGDTASFARAAGDDPGGWRLLSGVRIWF